MTEFDFDVITGPSGPMRRGTSACGWTPADEAEPPALVLRPPEREERRNSPSPPLQSGAGD
jgi:hypothetical protein